MLSLPELVQIHFCMQPTDMRKSSRRSGENALLAARWFHALLPTPGRRHISFSGCHRFQRSQRGSFRAGVVVAALGHRSIEREATEMLSARELTAQRRLFGTAVE